MISGGWNIVFGDCLGSYPFGSFGALKVKKMSKKVIMTEIFGPSPYAGDKQQSPMPPLRPRLCM